MVVERQLYFRGFEPYSSRPMGQHMIQTRDTVAFTPIPPAHALLKIAPETSEKPNKYKGERGRCTPFQDLYGMLVRQGGDSAMVPGSEKQPKLSARHPLCGFWLWASPVIVCFVFYIEEAGSCRCRIPGACCKTVCYAGRNGVGTMRDVYEGGSQIFADI